MSGIRRCRIIAVPGEGTSSERRPLRRPLAGIRPVAAAVHGTAVMYQIMCQPRVLPVWLGNHHGKEHPDATDCDDQELAFEVVKAMQTDGLDWGEGYRPRRALAEMDDGRGCRCRGAGIEVGLEPGASIDLDGFDGEGHVRLELVEEAPGVVCGCASPGLCAGPLCDGVMGGELLDSVSAGVGRDGEGVELDDLAGACGLATPWAGVWREARGAGRRAVRLPPPVEGRSRNADGVGGRSCGQAVGPGLAPALKGVVSWRRFATLRAAKTRRQGGSSCNLPG